MMDAVLAAVPASGPIACGVLFFSASSSFALHVVYSPVLPPMRRTSSLGRDCAGRSPIRASVLRREEIRMAQPCRFISRGPQSPEASSPVCGPVSMDNVRSLDAAVCAHSGWFRMGANARQCGCVAQEFSSCRQWCSMLYRELEGEARLNLHCQARSQCAGRCTEGRRCDVGGEGVGVRLVRLNTL